MGEPLGKGWDLRKRLSEASKLLEAAGFKVKDGELQNQKGEKFEFSFLLFEKSWERIVDSYLQPLAKIGIKAKLQVIDSSLFEQKLDAFDFDMVSGGRGQSESPGNELREYYSSASADKKGSRNLAGIKNPGIDKLIEAVVTANSRAALVTACHALDRAVWFEYYLVPNWYIRAFRTAWWNKFSMPAHYPGREASPQSFFASHAWFDAEKAEALFKASKDGNALPPAPAPVK